MQTLRWLRAVGDVIFVAGVVTLAWFVAGLKFGWSYAGARAARAVKLPAGHAPRGA